MPKMKTKRALAKRVKVTGSGKLKRHSAYTSHLAPRKTTKQKRHLRKASLVNNSDYKRVKTLIQQEVERWLELKTALLHTQDVKKS